MNVAGLARGLTQTGRYILGQEEQKRKMQQQLTLENMKNAMWQKRLQEETQRQKVYQQRLLEQYKANQQAEIKRAEIKANLERDLKTAQREYERPFKETEQKYKKAQIEKLTAQARGTGAYAKKGKGEGKGGGKEEKSTELADLLKMQKVFADKEEKTPADKIALRHLEDKIRDFGAKTYGVPTGIQGSTFEDTALNYYDQLVAGGIPEETAAAMTKQRFAQKGQQPKQPKKQKSLQEMSLDELYNELQKNE